ncbi:hypothetical protein BGZ80_001578, partial [Entomortierella chlamydospora]
GHSSLDQALPGVVLEIVVSTVGHVRIGIPMAGINLSYTVIPTEAPPETKVFKAPQVIPAPPDTPIMSILLRLAE